MSSHLVGGGHIVLVLIPMASSLALSAKYIVNQWLDSYQMVMDMVIDIQLGHNKEPIRFW